MPEGIYHYQTARKPQQQNEPLSSSPSPKRRLRRHTLATMAFASREIKFNSSPLNSPSWGKTHGPPQVPPKSPSRTPSCASRVTSDSTPAMSREKLADDTQDEDDLSAVLRELLSEMDASLLNGEALADDASSTLSRSPTLCSRQASRTDLKPPIYRSQTSNTVKIAPNGMTGERRPTALSRSNTKKVWQYSNSRLPSYLPALKVHTNAWPFLTMAAQFSQRAYRVYDKDNLQVSKDQVVLPTAQKTKPAIIQSVIVDDADVIVFAIRGTSGFKDWITNTDHLPMSPGDFIDDETNLCHSGFLQAARMMMETVASRLRTLLDLRNSPTPVSLLLTGHSAGGAVAQLLYHHMLCINTNSPLKDLKPLFEQIHCITFGAPPLSLRPIRKPLSLAYRESLFLAFANEGDPVVRSDKHVFKSLIRLYLSPVPQSEQQPPPQSQDALQQQPNWFWQCLGYRKPYSARPQIHSQRHPAPREKVTPSSSPILNTLNSLSTTRWKVPASRLSLAGSVILLREKDHAEFQGNRRQIEACQISNDMIQNFVFGDPMQHRMQNYVDRVEYLAKEAVTNAFLGATRF